MRLIQAELTSAILKLEQVAGLIFFCFMACRHAAFAALAAQQVWTDCQFILHQAGAAASVGTVLVAAQTVLAPLHHHGFFCCE